MTLLEVLKILRTSFLDDIGGTGVAWQDIREDDIDAVQLRWTNEELARHINEAVKQVYRRIQPVQLYEPEFDIDVVAGTAIYELDKRILRVIGARLTTLERDLVEFDQRDLWYSDTKWDTRTGNPFNFIPNYETGFIRLYPIPTATDTLKLFVNRLPLEDLDWTCNDGDVELRDEWIYPMLNYAAALAYMKDEANTYDPNKAATHEAKFNAEFPFTSAYSDQRKRRTNNKTINYGGLSLNADINSLRGRRTRNPYGCDN